MVNNMRHTTGEYAYYYMPIGYYWAHDLHPKAGIIWDIGSCDWVFKSGWYKENPHFKHYKKWHRIEVSTPPKNEQVTPQKDYDCPEKTTTSLLVD